MTLSLQPQGSFTIVRQIPNHLDTDTNYVQAVVRNAYTDEILATVKLTDRGSQRFSKNWLVPADSSGQGFFISIVTSVYTDSGYTTKNQNYGDDENTYLVQDRLALRGGFGGIDASTVRRIVKEEIAKIPQPDPVEIPAPKEYAMRWDEMLAAVESIKAAIPKPSVIPKTDLSSVLQGLDDVKQAIAAKEVTPPTDLTPVLEEVRLMRHTIMGLLQNIGDSIVTMARDVITKELSKMKWTSSFVTSAKKDETPTLETGPAKAPAQFDVTKLAA